MTESKTCEACRWFDSAFCLCCRSIDRFEEVHSDTKACEEFEEIEVEDEVGTTYDMEALERIVRYYNIPYYDEDED